MSGLQAREGAAPVLLHFIMQDRLQSPLREAPSHIADRRLTHIESGGKFGATPALGRFEQNTSAGDSTGVGFASMHKALQARAFVSGQGHGRLLEHGHPPFLLSISLPSPKPT